MCGPGRTLLLYDRYLLAHDVHVYPLQHGGHEQNEGEEPENGECVGVKAFFIGHMIGGMVTSSTIATSAEPIEVS